MSERKVREKADHRWSCLSHKVGDHEYRHGVIHEIHYPCDCGLKEALSEPPDVVKILRFVSSQWIDMWGDSKQHTIEHVIDYINEHFVRLTADGGWEWVEEEEPLDADQYEG